MAPSLFFFFFFPPHFSRSAKSSHFLFSATTDLMPSLQSSSGPITQVADTTESITGRTPLARCQNHALSNMTSPLRGFHGVTPNYISGLQYRKICKTFLLFFQSFYRSSSETKVLLTRIEKNETIYNRSGLKDREANIADSLRARFSFLYLSCPIWVSKNRLFWTA
jgi:hypothetical protein